MHTVDFPVPPLPDATTITLFIILLPLLYFIIKFAKGQQKDCFFSHKIFALFLAIMHKEYINYLALICYKH